MRKLTYIEVVATPWLRWMDVSAETWFITKAGKVKFVVDEVKLGLVFL